MRNKIVFIYLDLLSAMRESATPFVTALFFLFGTFVVMPLLPLQGSLEKLGFLWVLVIFSQLYGLESAVRGLRQPGVLDFWLSSGLSSAYLGIHKFIITFVAVGLPVLIFAPFAAAFQGIEASLLITFSLVVLLGVPCLALMVSFLSFVLLESRSLGLLMMVIALPFSVPVCILGLTALEQSSMGHSSAATLLLLAALLSFLLFLMPFLVSLGLKNYREVL